MPPPVAEEAAEAVVAEDQVPDRAVRRCRRCTASSPGQSVTASGHAALDRDHRDARDASWRTRTEQRGGPASRYAAASAGTTIQPWSIFVMKARPTTRPPSARCLVAAGLERAHREVRGGDEQQDEQRVRVVHARDRDRDRRDRQRAAPRSARPRPGDAPDGREEQRRRRRSCRAPAAAGSRSEEKPKTRADRPISHSDSGGLSTVMKLPGSSEPKNHAFQLSLAGLGGGGVVLVRVAVTVRFQRHSTAAAARTPKSAGRTQAGSSVRPRARERRALGACAREGGSGGGGGHVSSSDPASGPAAAAGRPPLGRVASIAAWTLASVTPSALARLAARSCGEEPCVGRAACIAD